VVANLEWGKQGSACVGKGSVGIFEREDRFVIIYYTVPLPSTSKKCQIFKENNVEFLKGVMWEVTILCQPFLIFLAL